MLDTTGFSERELWIYNQMFVRCKELEVELDLVCKTNDKLRKVNAELQGERNQRAERNLSRTCGQRVIRKHIYEDGSEKNLY